MKKAAQSHHHHFVLPDKGSKVEGVCACGVRRVFGNTIENARPEGKSAAKYLYELAVKEGRALRGIKASNEGL